MSKAIGNLDDRTYYAFCQGAAHYKRLSGKARPLLIYLALGGMVVHFSKRDIPSFNSDVNSEDDLRALAQAGFAGIGNDIAGDTSPSNLANAVRQASEIFRTPVVDKNGWRVQVERRQSGFTPPGKQRARQIWYAERPDDLQAFMACVDELIIARPFCRNDPSQPHRL